MLRYGAQRGRFLVQGGGDARAAIRLSGAQVLFGGDLRGFAFEYMTGGTAVVLGDPGRWICSGMSGGSSICGTIRRAASTTPAYAIASRRREVHMRPAATTMSSASRADRRYADALVTAISQMRLVRASLLDPARTSARFDPAQTSRTNRLHGV